MKQCLIEFKKAQQQHDNALKTLEQAERKYNEAVKELNEIKADVLRNAEQKQEAYVAVYPIWNNKSVIVDKGNETIQIVEKGCLYSNKAYKELS